MEKHVFFDTNTLEIMRAMRMASLRVIRAIPKKRGPGRPEIIVVYAVPR